MAIGPPAPTGQIPKSENLEHAILVGELSLDGNLCAINRTLAIALSLGEFDDYHSHMLCPPGQQHRRIGCRKR